MGIGFLPPITHILGRKETLLKKLINNWLFQGKGRQKSGNYGVWAGQKPKAGGIRGQTDKISVFVSAHRQGHPHHSSEKVVLFGTTINVETRGCS